METLTKPFQDRNNNFHLNNRQAKHEINFIFDGKEIANNYTPSYLPESRVGR